MRFLAGLFARTLLLIALALQPAAMAAPATPVPASTTADAASASGVHDCDGHHAATDDSGLAPARTHAACCVSVCCLAPPPIVAGPDAAHDWSPFSRPPTAQPRLASRPTAPDPPPPRFS